MCASSVYRKMISFHWLNLISFWSVFELHVLNFLEEAWTLDWFDKYETVLWSSRYWRARMSVHQTEVPRPRWDAIARTDSLVHRNSRHIHARPSAWICRRSLYSRLQSDGFLDHILYGGTDGLCGRGVSRGVRIRAPTGNLQTRLHWRIIQVGSSFVLRVSLRLWLISLSDFHHTDDTVMMRTSPYRHHGGPIGA